MGQTPSYGFPYPDATTTPFIHLDLKALAESVEAALPLVQGDDMTLPWPASANTSNPVNVVFPTAYGAAPTVVATATNVGINVSVQSVTATGFTAYGRRLDGGLQGSDVIANWIAVGSP